MSKSENPMSLVGQLNMNFGPETKELLNKLPSPELLQSFIDAVNKLSAMGIVQTAPQPQAAAVQAVDHPADVSTLPFTPPAPEPIRTATAVEVTPPPAHFSANVPEKNDEPAEEAPKKEKPISLEDFRGKVARYLAADPANKAKFRDYLAKTFDVSVVSKVPEDKRAEVIKFMEG